MYEDARIQSGCGRCKIRQRLRGRADEYELILCKRRELIRRCGQRARQRQRLRNESDVEHLRAHALRGIGVSIHRKRQHEKGSAERWDRLEIDRRRTKALNCGKRERLVVCDAHRLANHDAAWRIDRRETDIHRLAEKRRRQLCARNARGCRGDRIADNRRNCPRRL